MADAKSIANTLRQMAQLAEELESQGAEIISASFSSAIGCSIHLSAFDLPASIAERGVNRERCSAESDEIFYVVDGGVRVFWLVPREASDGLDAAIDEAMEKEVTNG